MFSALLVYINALESSISGARGLYISFPFSEKDSKTPWKGKTIKTCLLLLILVADVIFMILRSINRARSDG